MIRHFSIRAFGTSALAAMVLTGGTQQAAADLHGAVGGVIVACILTGTCGQQQQRRSTSAPRPTGISSAQRQQNRDVQNALNSFGWNVGGADGVLGRNSRRGISQYQAYMGWNADGTLSDFERETLVNSWRQFQAGVGNQYPNMMQREGSRGLLRTALNPSYPQQFGDGGTNFGGNQGNFGNNGGQLAQGGFGNTAPQNQGNFGTQPLQQPQGNGQTIETAAPTTLAPLAPLPGLGGTVATTSVASRCEIVNLKTEAAQGPILASNMTDPNQALSEKYCDAVSFSIAKSNGRITATGLAEEQLAQACGQIEDKVKPVFASLGSGAVSGTLTKMREINTALGLSAPANAQAYGEICVGMGYRKDDAEMALAGALVLTAANQTAYGELVGHHVREGFGVAAAPAAAQEWYSTAITALEQGQPAAFDPSSTAERVGVIRGAIEIGGLQSSLGGLPAIVPASTGLAPLAPLD
ncbi:MAG: peptidoglycan-binding domain-containing protein [Pseudomonadota bacterium]